MSDQSPYSIEERLIASVWMHERVRNREKVPEIRRAFEQRFGKQAPTPRILREWEKKVFETGSVLDAARCGRPNISGEHIAAVKQSILKSPTQSSRRRSAELQIPRSTLHKVLRLNLHQKVDLNKATNTCINDANNNNNTTATSTTTTTTTIPTNNNVQ
ncbi:eukaryotic translation initiation factor 1b-like isoform X1 [Argonauta hians]